MSDLYNKFLNEWSQEWINFIGCNFAKNEYNKSKIYLTTNPNVTLETIKNNPEINWNYNAFSRNRNVNYKLVKDNPEFKWDYYELSLNESITWSSIKNDIHKKPFNHAWLSKCLIMNLETVIENSNIEWNTDFLMKNKNIPIEKLIHFILQNNNENNLSLLCSDDENKLLSWAIYCREDVNFEMWKTLIDFEKSKHPYKLLLPSFSYNPNLTFEIIKNNPDLEWNNYAVSNHKNITWDIIKNNFNNFNWNIYGILSNQNITWEIIQNDEMLKMIVFDTDEFNNLNNTEYFKREIGKSLSRNPNISWEIVEENSNKIQWDVNMLVMNPMDNEREKYIRNKFQQWFKRSDLKRELMENVWHPRNFWKFKYFDDETFGDIEDDDIENNIIENNNILSNSNLAILV